MTDERDDWTDTECEALRAWGADWDAPKSLRAGTLRALVHGRREAHRRAHARWRTLGSAAAIAAIAFWLGLATGIRRSAPVPPAPRRYMLLLYEPGSYRAPADAGEERRRVEEYSAWARNLATHGRYVDGEELGPAAHRFIMRSGRLDSLPAMPHGDEGTLAGYFVIGAASQEEAVSLVRDCPHLIHGGSVEVRPIASH